MPFANYESLRYLLNNLRKCSLCGYIVNWFGDIPVFFLMSMGKTF